MSKPQKFPLCLLKELHVPPVLQEHFYFSSVLFRPKTLRSEIKLCMRTEARAEAVT